MCTNLRSKLIFGAAVILVALATVLVITTTTSAKKSDNPTGGMGDLRRFEAEQAKKDSEKLFADHPYIGMGDLRLYEALQARQDSEKVTPNPAYIWKGYYRTYESHQEIDEVPGKLFADHPYIGMGDLRYFESLQEKGFPGHTALADP